MQLFAYYPHQIDCERVLAGDSDYTKSLALHRPKLENDNLDMSCSAIKARFSSAPALNKSYAIAYARTVYKDYQFLEQQIWNSYTKVNWYCFSIDKKASNDFRSKINSLSSCLENFVVSNISRKIGGNGVNQNYAHLDCMQALETKHFEYIFLLQNHDILTRTHQEFANIFQVLEGSTIVDRFKCPSNRCPKSYPTKIRDLKLCPKSFKNEKLSSCKSSSIFYMKGGMQVIFSPINASIIYKTSTFSRNESGRSCIHDAIKALLPKEASDFIVRELNTTQFIEMFSKRFAGDEQFFPTLTANDALKIPGRFTANHCKNPRYLRYVVWFSLKKCKSRFLRHGICVFGMEDLSDIKHVRQFLINKMLPTFDNGIIQCHNEYLLKRSLGLEPSYDKIEHFSGGEYARFQRERRRSGFDANKYVCDDVHDRALDRKDILELGKNKTQEFIRLY